MYQYSELVPLRKSTFRAAVIQPRNGPASGMHMLEVSKALGHANPAITASIYAHLLPTEIIRSSHPSRADSRASLRALRTPVLSPVDPGSGAGAGGLGQRHHAGQRNLSLLLDQGGVLTGQGRVQVAAGRPDVRDGS
jgi:hypothetical protein